MFNRREFLQALGVGAAGALAGKTLLIPGRASAARAPGLPPNIITIMADDLGHYDLSIQGNKLIPTPNLEAMAAESVRFTCGYVTGSVCVPSRAGLQTGRYQQRFHALSGLNDNSPGSMAFTNAQERTFASYLHSVGYTTALMGKWHQGWAWQTNTGSHPMNNYGPAGSQAQGYDEFWGYMEGWHFWDIWPDNRGIHVNRTRCQTRDAVEAAMGYSQGGMGIDREFFTDALTNAAVDFINRRKDVPFYLSLFHGAPHTHVRATQRWLDRVPSTITDDAHRRMAAMIIGLDDGVGRVLQALRDNNIEQDTIVFFLSDNGGAEATDDLTGVLLGYDNFPLEGHKSTSNEGGIRVPFMCRWKNHITPGIRHTPVSSLDIAATAVAVAGATPLASRPLDGVNLMPWLLGQQANLPQRYLHWSGSWAADGSCTRDWSRYKLRNNNVYNLETDIEEKVALPATYTDPDTGETRAEILARMTAAFTAWDASW